MPLDLDSEELDSLKGDLHVAGSAIRKLLMHYNTNAETQVHYEINESEALRHQLTEVIAVEKQRHLLILNVIISLNTFSKKKSIFFL